MFDGESTSSIALCLRDLCFFEVAVGLDSEFSVCKAIPECPRFRFNRLLMKASHPPHPSR